MQCKDIISDFSIENRQERDCWNLLCFFCLETAQGCMDGAPNETWTHLWSRKGIVIVSINGNTLSDWWIFMACQPFWGYFIPKGKGITYILYSYLHFCEVVSAEGFFCNQLYNMKYFYLIWIFCTLLYSFKYSYLIPTIYTQSYGFK